MKGPMRQVFLAKAPRQASGLCFEVHKLTYDHEYMHLFSALFEIDVIFTAMYFIIISLIAQIVNGCLVFQILSYPITKPR